MRHPASTDGWSRASREVRLIVLECMILGMCAYPAWTDGEAVTLAADETQSTAADASSTYWYGAHRRHLHSCRSDHPGHTIG